MRINPLLELEKNACRVCIKRKRLYTITSFFKRVCESLTKTDTIPKKTGKSAKL
jgi:hypothetical protein